MAFPPLSYKASEVSPGETALYPYIANPATTGLMLPLLFGAQAARQGAEYSAGEAYKQDLALAMARQMEDQRKNMASEVLTGANSTNPYALDLLMASPAGRAALAGGGGTIDPQVAQIIGASRTGLARARDATTVGNYAHAAFAGEQAGLPTPPDVYSGQVGFPVQATDPLQMRIERMKEDAATQRANAAAAAASAPKPMQVVPKQDPNNPNNILFEGSPTDPRAAVGGAAALRNLNKFGQPIEQRDSAGNLIGYVAPTNLNVDMPAPIINKKTGYQGMTTIPLGTSTSAAGRALPAASNSSAPPSNSVAPSAQPGSGADMPAPPIQPQGTPQQGQAAAPQPQQGASRVQLPSNAPPDGTYVPDQHPNMTQANSWMQKYYENVQADQKFSADIKAALVDAYRAGRFTTGKDQTGRSWLMVNGQPVVAPGRR